MSKFRTNHVDCDAREDFSWYKLPEILLLRLAVYLPYLHGLFSNFTYILIKTTWIRFAT
jgi:hypothetical protein